MTVTKTVLIEKLAKEQNLTKKAAKQAVESILKGIQDSLANGENVQLMGFGTFTVSKHVERNGRNPQTGETIRIPEKIVPKFKPGKAFKEIFQEDKKKSLFGFLKK